MLQFLGHFGDLPVLVPSPSGLLEGEWGSSGRTENPPLSASLERLVSLKETDRVVGRDAKQKKQVRFFLIKNRFL